MERMESSFTRSDRPETPETIEAMRKLEKAVQHLIAISAPTVRNSNGQMEGQLRTQDAGFAFAMFDRRKFIAENAKGVTREAEVVLGICNLSIGEIIELAQKLVASAVDKAMKGGK